MTHWFFSMLLSSFWLPLVLWTIIGALVAGAGSWKRLAIFCAISFAIFIWGYSPAWLSDTSSQVEEDWLLVGIQIWFTIIYGIAGTGIFALLTYLRARHFERLALSQKGFE